MKTPHRHSVLPLILACISHRSSGAFLRSGAVQQAGKLATHNATDSSVHFITHETLSRHVAGNEAKFDPYARPPRIYFLFLAVNQINNFGIWRQFLSKAPPTHYKAYVHCKTNYCSSFMGLQGTGLQMQVVSTVNNAYCTDLVSPMNHLVASALADPGKHPADKFVFLSDSTLPAKSFARMYATLTSRLSSDFCVFPTDEWADVPDQKGMELAVKVHQWMVLSRAHAEKSVELWNAGVLHDLGRRLQLNVNPNGHTNNTYGDNRNIGCLDEFWHVSAIFGTLPNINRNVEVEVAAVGFTNAPLRVSPIIGWQGMCGTFALWSGYVHRPMINAGASTAAVLNPFLKLYAALDALSVPHSSNHRPGWWDAISRNGLAAIRDSEFLFIRKFIDNPKLVDGGDFATEYVNIVMVQ